MLKPIAAMRPALPLVVALLASGLPAEPASGQADRGQRPTFRGGVSVVPVSAVVRTSRGQPVTGLTRDDFEVLSDGVPRPIVEFRSDETPVRLALLVDISGSMDGDAKRSAVRDVTRHLVGWLAPGRDEVGLFGFDRRVIAIEPFAPAPGRVLERLEAREPYGATSLFDAIAETGRLVAAAGGGRRAIVALTDGADNSSRLTPGEVSGLASAIDVPVYIVIVVPEVDRQIAKAETERALAAHAAGPLANLARWTGGEILTPSGPAATSLAVRGLVAELRHQYVMAFEPDDRPGWHRIEVRTRRPDLVVRARSGYLARARPAAERDSR